MKLPQSKKFNIQKSRINGLGVFAKKNILKGETIFIIKGRRVSWIVSDQKTSLAQPNWIGIGQNIWIDPVGAGLHINHSCEPNAGIRGMVTVVALRNIRKGEEVTIDYSITETDKLWYLDCACQKSSCRKKIRSIQQLPIARFKRYLPNIPHHFQKEFKKHHQLR